MASDRMQKSSYLVCMSVVHRFPALFSVRAVARGGAQKSQRVGLRTSQEKSIVIKASQRPMSQKSQILLDEPTLIPRPDAPYELNDEEAGVWRGIVDSMPADHFATGNFPLLVRLCKHIIASRMVDQLIDHELKRKTLNSNTLIKLYAIQAKESQIITTLCRSMRLTQQSRWLPQTVARKVKGMSAQSTQMIEAPWNRSREDDDGDSGDQEEA